MSDKLLFILLLFILLLLTGYRSEVFAPELFSVGTAYGLHMAGYEIALIFVQWDTQSFIFLMYGSKQGKTIAGRITQLSGARITSYPPYECSTATTYCYERRDTINWRGWLEFRGHHRPFCGGQKLSPTCLIKEF